MKTKEELTALKNEVKALNAKLAELSGDELAQVIGGLENISPTTFYGSVLREGEFDSLFDGCPGLKPAPGLPAKQL